MNVPKKIAKNTLVLFIGQFLTYIFAFLFNMYSARYLGAVGFGILSFALAFTGIFSVISDLGISTLIVRDVARDKKLTNKYVSNVILIKIILVLVMLTLIAVTVNLLHYPKQTINVVYILSLFVVVSYFFMIFGNIFQAYEIMEYKSMSNILNSVLLFLGAIYAISKGLDVMAFAIIYLVTSIIVLFYNIVVYYWKIGSIKFDLDFKFWKYLVKEAAPLSISLIFNTITYRIDTILISLLIGNIAVGFYAASYNLMDALLFIPMVFSTVALPLFSKFYISSKKSLEKSYQKSINYLVILSLPIVVGTTLLAKEIILFIYGSGFTESILVLQILIWAIPFIFLRFIFKILLISSDKQNILLKIIILSLIINVTLNLIFIPKFGFIGAASITVLTEITTCILCYYIVSTYLGKANFLKVLLKSILACFIMALFIIYVKTNIFIVILISTIIYFAGIILLKTFDKEDEILLRRILERKS